MMKKRLAGLGLAVMLGLGCVPLQVFASGDDVIEVAPSVFGPRSGPSVLATGDQRTLVLLLSFQNSGPPPLTRTQVHDRIFNGQFQNFYHEQSYGRVNFVGTTTDWYTVPRDCDSTWLDIPQGNNEIALALAASGADIRDYDHLLMVVNCPGQGGGYSTVGKVPVSVGPNQAQASVSTVYISSEFLNSRWGGFNPFPFDFSVFDYTLSHEMGHALGLSHANGLDCGSQVNTGNCANVEYGNFFDVMGAAAQSLHFNAFEKERLGWIPSSKMLAITRPGTYTIYSTENSPTSGPIAAKIIPADTTTPAFYLEYRRGIGFDGELNNQIFADNQNGLLVTIVKEGNGPHPFTQLLDMTPTAQSWANDVKISRLGVGETFQDSATGMTIHPLSAGAGLTFQVEWGDRPDFDLMTGFRALKSRALPR